MFYIWTKNCLNKGGRAEFKNVSGGSTGVYGIQEKMIVGTSSDKTFSMPFKSDEF